MTERQIRFGGYDLTLAVLARQVLLIEVHSFEECQKLVYKPTDDLISQVSRSPPSFLTCLRGPLAKLGQKKGFFAHVDLVLPDNKIVYLGMVLDKDLAISYWKWCKRTYRRFPKLLDFFKKKGPFAIIKHKLGCMIPVEREQLDNEAIAQAVRKYLAVSAGNMASLPIEWLSFKAQLLLEGYMWHQANQLATPQTKTERIRVFEEDMKKGEYGELREE